VRDEQNDVSAHTRLLWAVIQHLVTGSRPVRGP
jgi:hypothetical protein